MMLWPITVGERGQWNEGRSDLYDGVIELLNQTLQTSAKVHITLLCLSSSGSVHVGPVSQAPVGLGATFGPYSVRGPINFLKKRTYLTY